MESAEETKQSPTEPARQNVFDSLSANWWEGGEKVKIGPTFTPRKFTNRDLLSIAALTSSLNVDGHRSDLVILKTARAHASFEGRTSITDRDIAVAAELALPHRIKRGPFHQSDIAMEDLQERIEQLQGASTSEGDPQPVPEEEWSDQKKKP